MKLRRTERLNKLLEEYKKQDQIEPTKFGEQWIDHRLAVKIGKFFSQPLTEVLQGTEVYIDPQPVPPPKTKAYVDLMARLKREEEEREYKKLTGLANSDEKMNLQAVTKEVNEQLTTIFNVLVSVVAVAWAFWYWCSSWYLGARILAALFAGIIVAIAEVVVLNGYYRRLGEGKAKRVHRENRKTHIADEKLVEKSTLNKEDLPTIPTIPATSTTSVSSSTANSASSTTKKRVTAH